MRSLLPQERVAPLGDQREVGADPFAVVAAHAGHAIALAHELEHPPAVADLDAVSRRRLPPQGSHHVMVLDCEAVRAAVANVGVRQVRGRTSGDADGEAGQLDATRLPEGGEHADLVEHVDAGGVNQLASKTRAAARARFEHENSSCPICQRAGERGAGEAATDDHDVADSDAHRASPSRPAVR